MKLGLKVIGGKNDGREIEINGPQFTIGRGEDVDLRPKSDLISRRHCVLSVVEGKAILKDLDSSNGTFLNNKQVKGEIQLKPGDRLRVGRLQFEILIDHTKPGTKRPKVSGVKDAAVRAVAGTSDATVNMEDSIGDWLAESEGESGLSEDQSSTVQFQLEDSRVYTPPTTTTPEPTDSDETIDKAIEDSVDESEKKRGKKKPGKLPTLPRSTTESSKDAATEALHKFFNRR